MSAINKSEVLEKRLEINQNRKKSSSSLLWGTVNLSLLVAVFYDVSQSCHLNFNIIQYVEYIVITIFAINTLYHFTRYFVLKAKLDIDTALVKKCAEIKQNSSVSPSVSSPQTPGSGSASKSLNLSNSMNMSWRSIGTEYKQNSSICSCHERRFSPLAASPYANRTPNASLSPILMPPKDLSGVDIITDENSLSRYLKDYENYEKMSNLSASREQHSNLLSTFWSHPATKSIKEISPFFRGNVYHTASRSGSTSPSSTQDDKQLASPILVQGIEIWKRFGVNITRLTTWNENLRVWISKTILERLIHEIDHINETLKKIGFGDIAVGTAGLDRLRKTAQLEHLKQFIPSLATLIPFLEVSTNQEYLVNRIRELAKGGCMSDFTWNGGGKFNMKNWEPPLPSDSAIIMHLFATYMDTQLMPLPNNPDAKPFTSYHFIKGDIPADFKKPDTLAIQNVSERPPQYRVIVGEEVYELQGHNSLLYSILFFLYQVYTREDGMLGRVNFGKAGLNVLWIIEC